MHSVFTMWENNIVHWDNNTKRMNTPCNIIAPMLTIIIMLCVLANKRMLSYTSWAYLLGFPNSIKPYDVKRLILLSNMQACLVLNSFVCLIRHFTENTPGNHAQ